MNVGNHNASTGAAAAETRSKAPSLLGMDLEFTQISDVGRVRVGNEDYLGFFEPDRPERVRSHGWMFAVADGVGGQELGEVASRTAVECVLEGFRTSLAGESHHALLNRLILSANTRIVDAGHAVGANMATTIVACALRYDRATIAHVGDSRCFLVRRGQAVQLTRDHTLANEQFRLGILSSSELARAETRHVLSRSLGSELIIKPDIAEHQLFAGDVLLLCSDGLHGSVKGAEMAAILTPDAELNSAAERLVNLANERDGGDNISALIIRIRNVERVGMYRGRPYRLP
ncbi:MAG TPA: protein phosphatase 2C domain-containing protein [Candidatus Acidoferrales bacterium]|nr:protein phosphatase 2C domain-containing protein [Candidatus Acidoferrales bacterium]